MIPILFCALSLAAAGAAAAEPAAPPVAEIVARANRAAYYQGRNGRARVSMSIRDAQGRERAREFTILRLDLEPAGDASDAFTGDQAFYVFFERPADVHRTAYLVHKHVGADDDRWLFLPGLDLVKRIAASDTRTSFVGSDFYYEDVSGRNPADDTHTLAETTDTYYVLKSTPKNPASVEFASYTMWIHKTTFLPVKAEYLDAKGEKIREMQALEVQTIQEYPTVVRSSMKNLRTGGETILRYSKVEYNIELAEDIFTERYLRNPPRALLR